MPHWSCCNTKYYWGILTRKGLFLYWKESERSNLPKYIEFSDEECKKIVWLNPAVTCYFPPVQHRTGPLKDKLCWPGRDFAMDVFKTVANREFWVWQNGQMVKQRLRIEQSESSGISIPEEEIEAMKEQQVNHRGKLDTSAQIINMETTSKKNETKKEKIGKEYMKSRLKVFKDQKDLEDTIWTNNLKDDDIIYGSQVKTMAKEVFDRREDANNEMTKLMQIPKWQAETVQNPVERKIF